MGEMDRTETLLAGTRVVELAGLGPAPFACQLLADLGCDIYAGVAPSAVDVLVAGAAADT
jgi:alpha-methylacyl-CoA racemase